MSRGTSGLAALLAGVFGATSASAAFIQVGSDMGVMTIDSQEMGVVTPTGTDTFNWKGSMTNSTMGWSLEWDLDIDTDPSISGVSAFTNITGMTSNFTFNVSAASTVAFAAAQVNGASALTLIDTNSDGATMSALSGGSIYDAFIDGTTQQALFSDPFSLVAPAEGVDVAASSWGPQAATGPLNLGDIFGINHAFSLTAGDQATVNSSFFIVPAPGSIGILALGGVIIARRRRA